MTTITLNFGLVATVDDDFVFIEGNTFANKDRLIALGAKWVPEMKAWMLGADVDLSSLELPAAVVAVGGGAAAAVGGAAAAAPVTPTIGKITITPSDDGLIYLGGETFPLRDQIKAHGGKWNAGRKLWTLPAETSLDFLTTPPAREKPKPKARVEWTREEWQVWISDYRRHNRGRVVRCCEHAVDAGDMYGPSVYNCPRHGETRGSYTGD